MMECSPESNLEGGEIRRMSRNIECDSKIFTLWPSKFITGNLCTNPVPGVYVY